jgi:hypothetical protein
MSPETEMEMKEVFKRELQSVLDVYDSHILQMQFARQRLITRFGDLRENIELRERASENKESARDE